MCVRKRTIYIKKPEDMQYTWRLPIQYQQDFKEGKRPKMYVKCGVCYECKKERARNWTYKIWLEAKDHKDKCFITLTYADDKNGTRQVSKRNLQLFIKRLRKETGIKGIKYFAAGEYGEKKGRAHYHVILLGYKPDDIRFTGRVSKKGFKIYSSKKITGIWGKGITTIQNFAYKEVAYLTLYLNKNSFIDMKGNEEEIEKRNKAMRHIQLKHGIIASYKKGKDKEYMKVKRVQDLTKEQFKDYRKDYREKVLSINMNIQNEFNLHSKGMGFDSYIKRQYYKYDLIIDGYTFERPAEFLRKVIENPQDYNEDVYIETVKELMDRRKYAEEHYEEITKEVEEMNRSEEKKAYEINQNKIRLYKKTDSIF